MSPAFFFDRNSLAVVQSEFYCPMGVSSWLSSARIRFPSVEKPWEKRQQYDVPTYYVSGEILAAALRTELPDDMVFEAIPFPCDALVSCCRKELCVTQPKAIVRFLS